MQTTHRAFFDELNSILTTGHVKLAVTTAQIRQGAKRIPGVSDFAAHPELGVFGGLTIPTRAHMGLKQRPAIEHINRMQKEMMPPGVLEHFGPHLESAYASGPGKILVSKDVGTQMHPGMSPQFNKNFGAFTTLHEAAERGAVAQPGSLHVSPDVLVRDKNMMGNLTGPGSEELKSSVDEIRAPEFAHLRGQVTDAFKDPRAAQYLDDGQKMNRSMRKAFSRELASNPNQGELMTPDAARGVGRQQTRVMEDRQRSAFAKRLAQPGRRVKITEQYV